jgi:hypothetical protein
MKVNLFEQSVWELQTVVLRGQSITADNNKIKRNKKKKGLIAC